MSYLEKEASKQVTYFIFFESNGRSSAFQLRRKELA
jgi:hypothetical protein